MAQGGGRATRRGVRSSWTPGPHGLGNELWDVRLGLSRSLREAWEVM